MSVFDGAVVFCISLSFRAKRRNPVLMSNEEHKSIYDSLLITRYSLGWILSLRFAPFRMTKAANEERRYSLLTTRYSLSLLCSE
jgi:hypothetical protein